MTSQYNPNINNSDTGGESGRAPICSSVYGALCPQNDQGRPELQESRVQRDML